MYSKARKFYKIKSGKKKFYLKFNKKYFYCNLHFNILLQSQMNMVVVGLMMVWQHKKDDKVENVILKNYLLN